MEQALEYTSISKENEIRENNKSDDSNDENIPFPFRCVICQDLYIRPITLLCGHSGCRHCLEALFIDKQQCPQCRQELPSKLPKESVTLRELARDRFPNYYKKRASKLSEEIKQIKKDKEKGDEIREKEYEERLEQRQRLLALLNDLLTIQNEVDGNNENDEQYNAEYGDLYDDDKENDDEDDDEYSLKTLSSDTDVLDAKNKKNEYNVFIKFIMDIQSDNKMMNGSIIRYIIYIILSLISTYFMITYLGNNKHFDYRLESMKISDWSVDDVILSLKYYDLEQFTNIIRKENVDGKLLLKLNQNEKLSKKLNNEKYTDLFIYSSSLNRIKIGKKLHEDTKKWNLEKTKTLKKLSKKMNIKINHCIEKKCIVDTLKKYSSYLNKLNTRKSFYNSLYYFYNIPYQTKQKKLKKRSNGFTEKSLYVKQYDFFMYIIGFILFPRITLFSLTYYTLAYNENGDLLNICGINHFFDDLLLNNYDEKEGGLEMFYLFSLFLYIMQIFIFPQLFCVRYGLYLFNTLNPTIITIFVLYQITEFFNIIYNMFHTLKQNNFKIKFMSLSYLISNKGVLPRFAVLCAAAFLGTINIRIIQIICFSFIAIRILLRVKMKNMF